MTNGNKLSVERLLSEKTWMRRLARRLTSDSELASDVEQETWLRALRQPAAVRSPRAWLASIARNVLIERRRAESRRIERERLVAPLESGDKDSLQRATLRRDIIDELLLLDEPDRSAVTLRYLEEHSYADVAAALDISEAAARKRVSRGVESLRQSLDDRHGGREAWVALALPWTGWAVPKAASAELVKAGSKEMVTAGPGFGSTIKATAWVAAALVIGFVGQWWLRRQVDAAPIAAEASLDQAATTANADSLARVEESIGRSSLIDPLPTAESDAAMITSVPAFSPRPASTLGSLDLRVLWSDRMPAAGVRVKLLPWGDPTPRDRKLIVQTDDSGKVLVEGLSAGRLGVYVDRGGNLGVDIVPDRVTTHEVTIPTGSQLRGVVRGPNGEPVAGAAVLLSGYFNAGHGKVVAVTGIDGRYELRDVHDAHYISARAEGYMPGCYEMLDGMAPGNVYERDLAVRAGNGAVAGQVVDGSGTPVSGALMRIGVEGEADAGGSRRDAFALVLSTDDEGRFEARDVGARPVTLFVRTESYRDAAVSVDPGDEGAKDLRIVLRPGSELQGTILCANGEPATDAGVTANLSSGNTGFGGRTCTADDQGRYRLKGLAPGQHKVFVHQREEGKASQEIRLEPGETVIWNTKLYKGRSAVGRLVDEDGLPLAGWMVGTQTGWMLWDRHSSTDDAGAFAISDLRDDATELHVTTPGGWLVGTLVTAEIVEPETVIVVPDSVRPSASVSLRVLGDGRPLDPPAEVLIQQLNGGYVTAFVDAQGEAEITRIVPGEFRLTVQAEGFADSVQTGVLAPEESRELGTIELVRGGRVRLELTRPALSKELAVSESAQLNRLDGTWGASFDLVDGVGLSGPLEPGDYVLWTYGRLALAGPRKITVTDGEVTSITEVAQAVGQARIRVTAEDPTALRGAILGVVTLANGKSFTVREEMTPDESGGCWLTFVSLPSGVARVEVTAGDGLVGVTTVYIDPSTKEGRMVEEVVEMFVSR